MNFTKALNRYCNNNHNIIFTAIKKKVVIFLLADPGEARGCSTNNFVTDSFINSVMVRENIFTAPPRHVTIFSEILNPKGHPNCITGLKVLATLLNEWILPIGGASSGRVCVCSLRSRLFIYWLKSTCVI